MAVVQVEATAEAEGAVPKVVAGAVMAARMAVAATTVAMVEVRAMLAARADVAGMAATAAVATDWAVLTVVASKGSAQCSTGRRCCRSCRRDASRGPA